MNRYYIDYDDIKDGIKTYLIEAKNRRLAEIQLSKLVPVCRMTSKRFKTSYVRSQITKIVEVTPDCELTVLLGSE